MDREPDVALLMIAPGSHIKLELETLKSQYFSRKLNGFVLHLHAGLNLAEGEKKQFLRIG